MAKRNGTPEHRSAQEKSSKIRKLKVRKSFYPYKPGDAYANQFKGYPTVPLIQLKGYWLNKAGFTIDTELAVHVKDSCITIKIKEPSQ